MLKQFKYAARLRLEQRGFALGLCLLLNIVFALCGGLDWYGNGGKVSAVVFSSLALCAVLIVSIIATDASIKTLFSAPDGYLEFLTPVPRRKILLGRLLAMMAFDIVSLAVGVSGVIIQSLILAGYRQDPYFASSGDYQMLALLIVVLLLYYVLLLLTCIFVTALEKSVFYRLRFKKLLSVLMLVAVLYVSNLSLLLLGLFCRMERYGVFFQVYLDVGLKPGMIVFFALILVEIVLLFLGTAYLMERKVNI